MGHRCQPGGRVTCFYDPTRWSQILCLTSILNKACIKMEWNAIVQSATRAGPEICAPWPHSTIFKNRKGDKLVSWTKSHFMSRIKCACNPPPLHTGQHSTLYKTDRSHNTQLRNKQGNTWPPVKQNTNASINSKTRVVGALVTSRVFVPKQLSLNAPHYEHTLRQPQKEREK